MNMNAIASNVKEVLKYFNQCEVETHICKDDTSLGSVIVRWGHGDKPAHLLDLTVRIYTKHAKVIWLETGLIGGDYDIIKNIIKAVEKKID